MESLADRCRVVSLACPAHWLLNSAYTFGSRSERSGRRDQIRKQDTECCAQEIPVAFEMQRRKSHQPCQTKYQKEITMSKEQENKAIVGRWFTEFWGPTCNLAIVDELAAADMLLQYSLHEPRRGHE